MRSYPESTVNSDSLRSTVAELIRMSKSLFDKSFGEER